MKKIINKIKNLERKDKTMFFLIFTTIGNIILAGVKLVFALTIPSMWFFVNSCFLIVLSLARFFSIRDYNQRKNITNKNEKEKIGNKNYLVNGMLLIVLGIMYFFVSVYMYYKGTNTTMHEYLTYLVALSAFWSISWAIYGMLKYKKASSPILKAVKMTNFANALTSIVLTQVTLLDTFSEVSYDSASVNGYTGMGVSLVIIILGLWMIISIKKDANI